MEFPAAWGTGWRFGNADPPSATRKDVVSGREGALKWVSLALLDDKGRVASSYFMSRVEANADATRSFSIDHTGRYVLRFTAQGAEGTEYKIELGGNALAMRQ